MLAYCRNLLYNNCVLKKNKQKGGEPMRKKKIKKIGIITEKIAIIISTLALFYFVACYMDIVANNTTPRRTVGNVEHCSKCQGERLP